MRTKILNVAAIMLAVLCSFAAHAGDVEDGDAATLKNNYSVALTKYKSAAVKNNAYAQLQVGNLYNEGLGVVQDYAEAVKWWKLAAAQGRADAQFNLAIMYDKGQGVVQDYAEAVKWWKLAAAQGRAGAQLNLGINYFNGQGVVQDYVRAHMWWNLSAAQGNANSAKNRDIATAKMNTQQIAEAQKLARECQARKYKNCD